MKTLRLGLLVFTSLLFVSVHAAAAAAAVARWSPQDFAFTARAAIENPFTVRFATRAKIIATRVRMAGAFDELGFNVAPSQANFIWATRDDRPVQPIYERLKTRKILVRYMKYADYGDGLRVSVGTPEDMEKFMTAFKKIFPQKAAATASRG